MTKPQKRYLAVGLSPGNFEDLPDGGLIVRDVPLLRVGTWTDSAVGTPLFYPADTLRKYATNWQANPYWNRHSGGTPHEITDKIAEIDSPRYMNDGVYADLVFHGATSQSRDAIAYLKWASANGKEVFSSVEHAGEERYNEETKRFEAKSLVFYGAAMVNRGACQTCQIPRANEELADGDGFVPRNPANYGKAPESQAWSKLSLSDFTDSRWEDLSEEEKKNIAAHFAYAGSLEKFSDLKLPHHDKSGNVVWAGVVAAYAALQGARGGVKIPDSMRSAVESHILAHYEDFDKDKPKELEEEKNMVEEAEFKKLADSVTALTNVVKGMVDEKKKLEASEAEAAKQKALADAIAEKTKALEDRLKALEDSEAPPKTGGKKETEDLGEPINRGLEYDAKDGSIRVM
jgi:hypothetical protein